MDIKKKVIILCSICLVILLGALIADKLLEKNYYKEIKYAELIEKIENKEDMVLLISQTTCSHCMTYKPKLEKVANEYKVYTYYIDVDLLTSEEEVNLKNYVNYSSTPATVFLHDGEEKTAANRINGDASTDKIIKKLKSNGFID